VRSAVSDDCLHFWSVDSGAYTFLANFLMKPCAAPVTVATVLTTKYTFMSVRQLNI
jgi:hypothetical protein